MKIKSCLVIFVMLMMSSFSFASEIGYIDMGFLVQNLKQVAKFNDSIKVKQEEFQKFVEKKEKEIADATQKQKDQQKIQEMMTKAQEELRPKQEELLTLQRAFETSLKMQIDTTSKSIAEEYNLDVVVNKEVLFYGGFDITNIVIDRLNQ